MYTAEMAIVSEVTKSLQEVVPSLEGANMRLEKVIVLDAIGKLYRMKEHQNRRDEKSA